MKSSILLFVLVVLNIPSQMFAEDDMTNRPAIMEKTVMLDGKPCVLSGAINKDTGRLEILRVGPANGETASERVATKVAEVALDDVAPYDFDFALSSNGEILWVFFKKIDPLGGRRKSPKIWVFGRTEQGGTFKYVTSFNLSEMLQDVAMKKLRSGNPLPLSRGSRISVLSIQCTNSTEATISGKWGEQCVFNVHLCLGSTGLSPKEWDLHEIPIKAEAPK